MDIGVGKPINQTQRAQAEGRESRQAVLDHLLECLTSPDNPMDVEQPPSSK